MQTIDFSWLFVKMLGALVVAVGLAIFVLRVVVPRLNWTQKLQQNSTFKILARTTLGHRSQLYLVKIGKKNIVLGANESGLHKIMELSNEELES